jgi:hypothetical protein
MKKEVDLEAIHPLETHIQSNRSHMESSQMTKSEMDPRRPSQQMDSSHSASPVGGASVTTPPRSIINNVQEAGRGHALADDRSLANSGESEKFSHAFLSQKNIFKLFYKKYFISCVTICVKNIAKLMATDHSLSFLVYISFPI